MYKKSSKRLLIFIVAYNAKNTLYNVLKRIPQSIYQYDYQILIIDDSSKDETFKFGLEYKHRHPELNIEILYNPEHQGYGGNQKLGYEYAIRCGFDVIVLLHGDGKYAPEILEDLALPVLYDEVDVVLGSRMIRPWGALKGGMPLYKFIGNRILTWVQNLILATNLSEFHSGYRAYSVKAISEIPFKFNTNDFHFDSEIIIQLILKKFRIKETPIPTYYGNEICYVKGAKYAWNVIRTTINSRLQCMGIFYRRKFDIDNTSCLYDLKLGYTSSHTMALEEIQNNSKVLDIGSGDGLFAEKLKEKNCSVYGLDSREPLNPMLLDYFKSIDLNQKRIELRIEEFDYILLLDVIEHLMSPENLLSDLRELAKTKKPTIIITVPNIAFFITRFRLFMGEFQYGKQGILDLTHYRLFTKSSILNILKEYGYKIICVKGIPAPYPKAFGDNLFSRFLLAFNSFLIGINKNLFSYQIYLKTEPLPTVTDLLKETLINSNKLSIKHIKKNHGS